METTGSSSGTSLRTKARQSSLTETQGTQSVAALAGACVRTWSETLQSPAGGTPTATIVPEFIENPWWFRSRGISSAGYGSVSLPFGWSLHNQAKAWIEGRDTKYPGISIQSVFGVATDAHRATLHHLLILPQGRTRFPHSPVRRASCSRPQCSARHPA